MKQYNIYPTLLDSFARYQRADEIWEEYYGASELPSISVEAFRQQAEQDLIDKVNRKPFASIDASRGTALNNLIDELLLHPEKLDTTQPTTPATHGGYTFLFPTEVVANLAKIYKDTAAQGFLEGDIETTQGKVHLYGFADYIAPTEIHDLKVTKKYKQRKFFHNWQHRVYPLLASDMAGQDITLFHYDVVELTPKCTRGVLYDQTTPEEYSGCEAYRETYFFGEDDRTEVRNILEDFIIWLESNRDKITDKKIYNEHE